jgi:hypothetical protein
VDKIQLIAGTIPISWIVKIKKCTALLMGT